MKQYLLITGLALMLLLSACTKPPTATHDVYFGSGAGCHQRGICYHPPLDRTIPATFTLLNPKLLQISFRMADLSKYQHENDSNFIGKTSYIFDNPWIAPKILDSELHLTKPLIIHPGKYTTSIRRKICYMMIPLGTSFSTTVKFGRGQSCNGRDICGAGGTAIAPIGINANFTYDQAFNMLTLDFNINDLMASNDPVQAAHAADFKTDPGTTEPQTVFYPFDADWAAPQDMNAALCPDGSQILIHANVPNQVSTNDGVIYAITFNLNAPPR